MARVTSTRNSVVRYVRSLERGTVREAEGVYLVEGVRLVTEAMASGQTATLALYDPVLVSRSSAGSALLGPLSRWADRSYEVDARVLRAAAQTETPSGVLAALRRPQVDPLQTYHDDRLCLILDRLSDPGNAGTILRTADAAGVGFVVTLPGSVDLFAPKVVRAGMGAHFRVPLYPGIPWSELDAARGDVPCVAIEAHRGESLYTFRWPERVSLLVGSEAHGISAESQERVNSRVHIPMKSGVESLNAAVAASIVIYSALRPANSSAQ
jgi:RNA methyltransferase, TrmH family